MSNQDHVTKENARETALKLTARIHDLCGKFREAAGTPDADRVGRDLEANRRRRREVYALYEYHFGLDLVDELLEECDEYFNTLTGIAR